MNDFNRCNKLSGVYWLKEPVDNISINVKLKSQDGIISLPKFEDYTNETNVLNVKLENRIEEHFFKWQEKVFSSWELQRYSDSHNCLTDVESSYHNMIKDIDYKPQKVFSYVHEDYHLPLPTEFKKKADNIHSLNLCFEYLNLEENMGRVLGGNTVSMKSLFRSEENIDYDEEQWTSMHIVFDHSDYNEDAQLLLKQETTLLSLYYNKQNKYLIVTPDVNNLELNPYTIEVDEVPLGYQYGIEVEFGDQRNGEDLVTMLCKLTKRWEHSHKNLTRFVMPSGGRRQNYLTLELLTAAGFDMDNLYIDFHVKVPEDVDCKGAVNGKTHTSKSITIDDTVQWNYAHIHDLILEFDADVDPPPPQLYLEAISTDWWGRHRTEGYTHLPLTSAPGVYSKQLSCFRPEELDKVEAQSRRFFVGGCHLIKDLDVLARPQLQDTTFTYHPTGVISVRWTVVSVSAPLGSNLGPRRGDRGSGASGTSGTTVGASGALAGAEAALAHYRRARARLARATHHIHHRELEESTGTRKSGGKRKDERQD